MIAVLLALATTAGAATRVVHDSGDPTNVLRRVSERTALPMEQLEAVHVDTLTERPAVVSGAGSLRHCAGTPVSTTELRALQLRAESAWRAGAEQDALDQLDLGMIQLGCLRERVDRKTATRMFLLRAGLLARQEQFAAALQEARSALAMTPDVEWDDTLPAEGAEVLESARNTAESAALTVAPSVTTPPWIDGTPLPTGSPLARRPGLHLVQIPATAGLQSAWLSLDGAAVLVLPGSFRAPVLASMTESDPALLHLLQATLGTDPTYVATSDALWLVTYGAERKPEVEVLEAPASAPKAGAVNDRSERKRRR